MGRLDGKVAVILGAASPGNMGQAMARRFAAEGARVVVAGRHQVALDALAAEIQGTAALCDITQKNQVEDLATLAEATYGRIDIAVNCTGSGLIAKLLETTEEDLDRITALQFKGPYFFFQAFVGRMAKSGGGSVITMTSASTKAVLWHHAAYIGTKSGTDAVMRCFANEFGSKGVRVNSIAAGFTESPMTEDVMQMPGLAEAFLKEYPMGRLGTVDDVADAALWLASDECFVTGEVLQVNGGLTLRRNPSAREINASMTAARSPT
jgi:NAD(P)-dependent dehydrogenase (short-subunit alcohol dehydrogenase family)